MADIKTIIERQCFACLSIGRKMIKFGGLINIFKKLFQESLLPNPTDGYHEGLLCWECHAALTKIHQFLVKVQKAHNILKIGENLLHGSLSNLTTMTINDIHNTVYVIEQTNIQSDLKERVIHNSKTVHNNQNDESNDIFDGLKTDNECVKLEDEVKRDKRKTMKINNWAQKRALINKQPKFRTFNSIDAVFKKKTEFECKNCCLDFNENNTHNKVLKTFICDICKKFFAHKDHLASHLSNHSIFVCKLCELPFVKEDRIRHVQSKHGKALQCVQCGLIFEKRREFFKHYKHWHERYVCDYCGVSFKMRYCIKNHIKKQHTNFQCKPCGKSFSWYNSLWLHKKMHHSQLLPAFCVECNTHYPDVYRYRWHLANSVKHRPPKKTRYPCTLCDKDFSKKIYMSDHYNLVHLKHYKYRCEECNKNYIRNAELLKHRRRVHEGVLPLKDKICPTCGRAFTTNKILSNHVRTHTGERPFTCQICPAKFTQSAALLTHTRAKHPD